MKHYNTGYFLFPALNYLVQIFKNFVLGMTSHVGNHDPIDPRALLRTVMKSLLKWFMWDNVSISSPGMMGGALVFHYFFNFRNQVCRVGLGLKRNLILKYVNLF